MYQIVIVNKETNNIEEDLIIFDLFGSDICNTDNFISFCKEHNCMFFARSIFLTKKQLKDNNIQNILFWYKLKNINIYYKYKKSIKMYEVYFNNCTLSATFINDIISFEEYFLIIENMIKLNVNLSYVFDSFLLFKNKIKAKIFIDFLSLNKDFDNYNYKPLLYTNIIK